MATTLITPPDQEPISLAEARAQCRISADDTSEDTLLAIYIAAARETAEHELGRKLIDQTWEQTLDAFPCGDLGVKLAPAQARSIVSVQYNDPTLALQTMDSEAYLLDSTVTPGWLLPTNGTTWPATADAVNSVRIRLIAGYGPTSASVPANVRNWLLLTIGALYAQREAVDATGRVGALPARFVDRLLDSERIYG